MIYHLHSDLSNGVTNVDSVTKYQQYVDRAAECGMKAMGFSEHGSIFEWWHKKKAIEAIDTKYIHAIEAYLTADLNEKTRDNFHCVLIARNYDGFLELNRIVSRSFNRRDNHFYYVPRISFDELFATSNNIIVTTACVGGVFGKGDDEVQKRFLQFMLQNRDRCFFEIGHHLDQKQVTYNKKLLDLSDGTGIPLIAGTDTHVLNSVHEKGRSILQQAKDIHFDGEDLWDLKFKTYDELVDSYQRQNAIPEEDYLRAIENTNVMADMVEEFTIDCGTKYPHIYQCPEQTFKEKIDTAIETHPYALKNHTREDLQKRVDEEFDVYKKTGSIDFMLLQTYIREWEKETGIQSGYGRGSVSGSMIAYLLGITQMDSMRFNLNFFRFMNPNRVSNADIDTDYSGTDRDTVKQFLLRDKMNLPNIQSAEIITFNTIALRGAIRDVCRALYKDMDATERSKMAMDIADLAEGDEEKARSKYPDVFEYVDIINGTIVSIGTHPSGVLISDKPIDELVGLCSVSTSEYPVSMLNMKELDDQMWVKLDELGLDNLGVINDTCRYLGIERLTPDNTDLNDVDVWKSIRDDTTLVFQWESNSAQQYIRKFMSDSTVEKAKQKIPRFSMLKWLSFGNGLIRPACASFRDSVADGEFYDNGFDALNDFLAPEAGRIAMQETIMRFLVQFCGYSQAESDNVRRAIAKKKGTEDLVSEIERRFIEYCPKHYDITAERCAEVIKPFIQIILDASAYGFSWNHSDAYSAIGYICGYLRYYHPLQFLTAALNIFGDNTEKLADITKYATKRGIMITTPKWGASKGDYYFNEETSTISKGLSSIKYMNSQAADELYELAHSKHYDKFTGLLTDIVDKTSLRSNQLDVLIKINFFQEFGNMRELLRMTTLFDLFKKGKAKRVAKDKLTPDLLPVVAKYGTDKNKSSGESMFYTITDMPGLLAECETTIKRLGIPDADIKIKMQNQLDYMGYIDLTTNKKDDRYKLLITDVYPVKSRSSGEIWGYALITRSIGTGKTARLTAEASLFNRRPVKKLDIIETTRSDLWQSKSGYWNIANYKQIA